MNTISPPNGEKFFAKGKSCQKQTFSARRGVDAERGAVFFYILVSPGDQKNTIIYDYFHFYNFDFTAQKVVK